MCHFQENVCFLTEKWLIWYRKKQFKAFLTWKGNNTLHFKVNPRVIHLKKESLQHISYIFWRLYIREVYYSQWMLKASSMCNPQKSLVRIFLGVSDEVACKFG